MKLTRIGMDLLLTELADLPSEWMDDEARRVVPLIPVIVQRLRDTGREISLDRLAEMLVAEPLTLDILRLLTGDGQEPMAHRICDALGGKRRGWKALRTLTARKPSDMAAALVKIGVPAVIRDQLWREWTISDVLVDRYKLGRGRAIAGQSRGRGLENEVEAILRGIDVPFEMRVTFTGPEGHNRQVRLCDPDSRRTADRYRIEGI